MNNSLFSGIITVAIADDHAGLREALSNHINSLHDFKVIIQAGNGRDLLDQITEKKMPDIALLDISMHPMDGYETAKFLSERFPSVKTMAYTMYDSEEAAFQMLRCGAKGFLPKNAGLTEMKTAFTELMTKGNYFGNGYTRLSTIKKGDFTEKEILFLKLCCTDMKYEAIASQMNMSFGGVDKIRQRLFDYFEVNSRQCLAIKAVKSGLI